MQFWDTAGQDVFRSMSNVFYKNCHGVILCYDITSKKSFENLGHWTNELLTNLEKVPTVLLGNKSDLEDKREVDSNIAVEYAKNNGFMFGEVSALKNEDECISRAINELVNGEMISYYTRS